MYHTPDDLAEVGDDDEDADERERGSNNNRAEGGSQDGTHGAAPNGVVGGAQHRDSVHAASAPAALAYIMAQERFPIPIEVRKRYMCPGHICSLFAALQAIPTYLNIFWGMNLNLHFPGQTVDDTHHTRESMGAWVCISREPSLMLAPATNSWQILYATLSFCV